jgi:RNA polymerase sigma factor for flagellar operon FliA
LRGAQEALRVRLGREPTSAELCAALEIGEAELEVLRQSSEPLQFESIDQVYSESDLAFADVRPDPHELAAGEELRHTVAAAIADLPERLQLVVQLYFVEELNLAEIAETLRVSIPRVHQLKAQALERLRDRLDGIAAIL